MVVALQSCDFAFEVADHALQLHHTRLGSLKAFLFVFPELQKVDIVEKVKRKHT